MKNDPICPQCNSSEVKRIIYGMPGSDFEFDKYEVGGCIIEDDSPQFKCMNCKTTW